MSAAWRTHYKKSCNGNREERCSQSYGQKEKLVVVVVEMEGPKRCES